MRLALALLCLFAVSVYAELSPRGKQFLQDIHRRMEGRHTKAGTSSLKILGGHDATPGDFPWHVSLQIPDSNFHYCGGMLIAKNLVLTAAHCWSPVNPKVVIGATNLDNPSDGEVFTGAEWIPHPLNDFINLEFDGALLRLNGVSSVQPVQVGNIPPPNTPITIVGHGETMNLEVTGQWLQQALSMTASQQECEDVYADLGWFTSNNMLCMKSWSEIGQKTCFGDSGSPLLQWMEGDGGMPGYYVAIGVTSWGGSDNCDDDLPWAAARIDALSPAIVNYLAGSEVDTSLECWIGAWPCPGGSVAMADPNNHCIIDSCPGCGPDTLWIGDGWCDPQHNTGTCAFDLGDCCAPSCPVEDFCVGNYDCKDPSMHTCAERCEGGGPAKSAAAPSRKEGHGDGENDLPDGCFCDPECAEQQNCCDDFCDKCHMPGTDGSGTKGYCPNCYDHDDLLWQVAMDEGIQLPHSKPCSAAHKFCHEGPFQYVMKLLCPVTCKVHDDNYRLMEALEWVVGADNVEYCEDVMMYTDCFDPDFGHYIRDICKCTCNSQIVYAMMEGGQGPGPMSPPPAKLADLPVELKEARDLILKAMAKMRKH